MVRPHFDRFCITLVYFHFLSLCLQIGHDSFLLTFQYVIYILKEHLSLKGSKRVILNLLSLVLFLIT